MSEVFINYLLYATKNKDRTVSLRFSLCSATRSPGASETRGWGVQLQYIWKQMNLQRLYLGKEIALYGD
jgi:hypothetical protein